MNKVLGRKIKQYRYRHNLTQGDFAKLCGISVPTVVHVENADRYQMELTFKVRSKIEKVLNEEVKK